MCVDLRVRVPAYTHKHTRVRIYLFACEALLFTSFNVCVKCEWDVHWLLSIWLGCTHNLSTTHGNRDGNDGVDSIQLWAASEHMYGWCCRCCCCGRFFGDSNQHNHESAMCLRRPFFPSLNVLFCCRCCYVVFVVIRCAIESQKGELNFISFRRTLVCFDCCNIKLVTHRIESSF